MIDWLGNLWKSAEERRKEASQLYVDGRLSGEDRAKFEQQLREDVALVQEVERLRRLKIALRSMPRVPVPRNFLLDATQLSHTTPPKKEGLSPLIGMSAAFATFATIVLLAGFLFTQQPQTISVAMSPENLAETASETRHLDPSVEKSSSEQSADSLPEAESAMMVAPVENSEAIVMSEAYPVQATPTMLELPQTPPSALVTDGAGEEIARIDESAQAVSADSEMIDSQEVELPTEESEWDVWLLGIFLSALILSLLWFLRTQRTSSADS